MSWQSLDYDNRFTIEYDWSTTGDDSDYLSSTTLDLGRSDQQSLSGISGSVSSIQHGCISSGSVANSIPPPSFATLPRLQPVERVMNNNPGSDVASLRILNTAYISKGCQFWARITF